MIQNWDSSKLGSFKTGILQNLDPVGRPRWNLPARCSLPSHLSSWQHSKGMDPPCGWLSKLRSPFGSPKYLVAYYTKDPKGYHNFDNPSCSLYHLLSQVAQVFFCLSLQSWRRIQHTPRAIRDDPRKRQGSELGPQRPPQRRDPTFWFQGLRQGGFQKPWFVGSYLRLWNP